MKIQVDRSYPVPSSPDVAWALLQDLEAVAGCMPGANIGERLDAGRYRGTVTARVGPATMSFRGEVELKDVEPATRSLRLLGRGTDSTGSSAAALSLTARIEAAPGGQSILAGASEMVMSGKAAAFGGRLMNQVADQILKQFADNFAAQAAAREAQRGSAARGVPAPAAPAPALNILALAWTLLRNWLRRLFPGSAA